MNVRNLALIALAAAGVGTLTRPMQDRLPAEATAPATRAASASGGIPAMDSGPEAYPTNPEAEGKVRRLQPGDLHQLLAGAPKPLIIDTRRREAFLMDHLPGALNISLADFPAQWRQLPRDRFIALYCT